MDDIQNKKARVRQIHGPFNSNPVVRPFGKTQGPEQVEGQAQTSSEPQSNSHPVFDPEAQTRREPAEGRRPTFPYLV